MMVRRRLILFLAVCLFLLPSTLLAQVNVLFVGNSYTEVNNLPQMTANVARSMGFEMAYSSNTPGGCTFSQHCTNQSINLIRQGGWDFVVLQEQSQYPSFPQSQVEAEVFPYAAQLVEAVYSASPCAEPMFYMTWGRRDGDAQNAQYFPVLGTYDGMDSMLYERYVYMAEANDASVCPVGRVWRSLREHHSEIELYQSDGSHPSTAGTYAAACAFAVMFFHGNPETIAYIPEGLPEDVADAIRQTVYEVVYTQQDRWLRPLPQVTCELDSVEDYVATFLAHATYADSLFWDFGDGTQTATIDTLVQHTYADTGDYLVTLIATRHCMADTAVANVHITLPDIEGITDAQHSTSNVQLFPNPSTTLPFLLLDGKDVSSRATVTTPDGRTLPFNALRDDAPAGTYLIHVHADGRSILLRYIKL